MADFTPTLLPLGDSALLIRFATRMDEDANAAAIVLASQLRRSPPVGAIDIVSNLVSVLISYDPAKARFADLAAEVRLKLSRSHNAEKTKPVEHTIPVTFGGAAGPDLSEVAEQLGMSPDAFIKAHNDKPLRVLTTGFAPGFVYCGMHAETLHLPRRTEVRPKVSAGAILFAAGQTAITATPIPTGWHVIGHTDFDNFDPDAPQPTKLAAGDVVTFEVAK